MLCEEGHRVVAGFLVCHPSDLGAAVRTEAVSGGRSLTVEGSTHPGLCCLKHKSCSTCSPSSVT